MRKCWAAGASFMVIFLLSGCVTMSGTYLITAHRFDGTPLNSMMAEGSGIYTVKNAICLSEPGAVITIKDAKTGQEIQSESPHQCGGMPFADVSLQAANQKLEKQFSPIRLVTSVGANQSGKATTEWAGTPGPSIVENAPLLKADVLGGFKSKCGLDAVQLSETRVVKYAVPVFYEVWVFDDPLSERDDKKTALSLVLRQRPGNGGVDFSFYGACHGKKMPLFQLAK